MENYQKYVSFICTTNFLNRIEYPVQTRFNFKFNLSCSNIDGVYNRIVQILNAENVQFVETDLRTFVEGNHQIGLRNMINLLQINHKNGSIDFSNIKGVKSEQEEQLVELVLTLLEHIRKEQNFNIKITMINLPLQTSIGPIYSNILELINYNIDINYHTVLLELFNQIKGLPYLTIIDKYIQNIDSKRYPNLHFISFIYEMIKCSIEVGI